MITVLNGSAGESRGRPACGLRTRFCEVTLLDGVEQLTGAGSIYRSDGSRLPGPRRYAFTLVPWYEPSLPLAIGSWVQLYDREPLELENEPLSIELNDGRWFTFRVTDVSETPPHHYTVIAQRWPAARAG